MNKTHSFSTPLARDIFVLGCDAMMGGEPTEYRFGYLHKFSDKPVHLPTVSPRDVAAELDRLKKPSYRGAPHE